MDRTEFEDLQHSGMNTLMAHRAAGPNAGEALRAVKDEAARLEGLLSRFLPESDVSRVNRSAGVQAEHVSSETFAVLARALALSAACGGLFDVTVGPLVDAWRGSREKLEPPDGADIRRALALIDYRSLSLYEAASAAGLLKQGQSLDLGGIAKGYAADRFLDVFRQYGVRSAFTNIGGNVAALGCKPDGSEWRVGIRHPRREGALLGLVAVAGQSVVTSGDYQRFFIGRDGTRYHHILDPRTGCPADAGLTSATVVAQNSMDADALSTAVFVAGEEAGLALLGQFPGAEAVLVDADMRVKITAGLKDCFQAAEGIDFEIVWKGTE